jgi:hypothetical protein
MRELPTTPRGTKPSFCGEGMTGYLTLLGLLALLVGHFIAADLSDLEFMRRPENQNYD